MEGLWVVRDPEALPPPEYRLLSTGEKIETPVDSRGIVDIPNTIKLVKSTIDPAYQWHGDPNVHHFLHPDSAYAHIDKPGRANPAAFRNLPIFKGLVPRDFENWLHRITLPPPMAEDEVMQYMCEAWEVASDLFKMARKTIQWQRRARRRQILIANNPDILKDEFDGTDLIGEEVMHDLYEKSFRGLEHHFNRLDRIPPEFRIIDKKEEPRELAASLGRFVIERSADLVRAVAA